MQELTLMPAERGYRPLQPVDSKSFEGERWSYLMPTDK